MRIGVNCFLLQKKMGGLKQYFHLLFRWLLEFDTQNTYVFFYFEKNREELAALGNDRWKDKAILLRDQRQVLSHLGSIDLYFCPFCALWPRPVPLPTVVTLVDIQEKYFPRFFSAIDLWNRELYYDGSTKIADQVITISEFSKNSIVQHHGVTGNKINVAYLCVDDAFSQPVKPMRRHLALPEDFLFYPANHWLHKNHDNLLKALAIIKNKYKENVNCILSGFEISNGFPLTEKLKEYGIENQVRNIGYVDIEELKFVYSKAKILCFPSLFEGFGIPVVEAMSMGCPVVCSNTTSLPEIANQSALLFNPANPEDMADKIYTIWKDKKLRNSLAQKGLENAKRFSIEKTARKHIETFQRAAVAFNKPRFFYHKYIYEPLNSYKMHIKKRKALQG